MRAAEIRIGARVAVAKEPGTLIDVQRAGLRYLLTIKLDNGEVVQRLHRYPVFISPPSFQVPVGVWVHESIFTGRYVESGVERLASTKSFQGGKYVLFEAEDADRVLSLDGTSRNVASVVKDIYIGICIDWDYPK